MDGNRYSVWCSPGIPSRAPSPRPHWFRGLVALTKVVCCGGNVAVEDFFVTRLDVNISYGFVCYVHPAPIIAFDVHMIIETHRRIRSHPEPPGATQSSRYLPEPPGATRSHPGPPEPPESAQTTLNNKIPQQLQHFNSYITIPLRSGRPRGSLYSAVYCIGCIAVL